ncbi:hypothetical protein HYPSUDRAFT_45224 [Hypholoma sublateritium FD-334 SS-4]|uniref:DUF6699 domain-containing protein n=1 Tax=Hypholoma sublateritium (strain FD-334 SS-4) TaxID=945553 RepID=A0A0D2PE92_HYPSF|nr:hypothetical protein HYPSUDRAFT_45224 [Hypholoma sublateritium FD-334 SS-4]
MQANTSLTSVTPVKKHLRFAATDTKYELPSSDSEDDELLRTPTGKLFNPHIKNEHSPPDLRFAALPSDANFISSTRSEVQMELSQCAPCFEVALPVLHPALDTGAAFIWDMATHPEGLKFVPMEGDDPAGRTEVTRQPLRSLVFVLEGIYVWSVVAEADEGRAYPTLLDALVAIHTNMMKLAARQDVDVLDEQTRRRLFESREARCREFALNTAQEGLRRVDFLLGARRFLGISASPGTGKLTINVGVLPSQKI